MLANSRVTYLSLASRGKGFPKANTASATKKKWEAKRIAEAVEKSAALHFCPQTNYASCFRCHIWFMDVFRVLFIPALLRWMQFWKQPCFFPDLLLAGRLSRGLSLSHFLTPVAVAANQVTVAMAPIVMITLAMWNSKPWTRQVDKPCEDMEQTEQTFQFLQFLPAQVL